MHIQNKFMDMFWDKALYEMSVMILLVRSIQHYHPFFFSVNITLLASLWKNLSFLNMSAYCVRIKLFIN